VTCPKCGGDTTVADSRRSEAGDSVRRRRRCLECNFRFSTLEIDVDYYDQIMQGLESYDKLRNELRRLGGVSYGK